MIKSINNFGNLVFEEKDGTKYEFEKSPSWFGRSLVIGGIAIPDESQSNGYRNHGLHLAVDCNLQLFLEKNVPLEIVQETFDFLIEIVEKENSEPYSDSIRNMVACGQI